MTYLPVLILMLAGAGVGVLVLLLSHVLGVQLPSPQKNTPFECGVPPYGDTKHRFSVRFYLVAILFLLFDVEAVFFFPWAVVFKKLVAINQFIIWEMGVFVGVFVLGYLYVLRKGALEWE